MRRAAEVAAEAGAKLVIALQPGLPERDHPSPIELEIRESAEAKAWPSRSYRKSYETIREGLAELAEGRGVTILDLSRVFEDELATTFIDTWHFTDPGHGLLADRLTEAIEPILRRH